MSSLEKVLEAMGAGEGVDVGVLGLYHRPDKKVTTVLFGSISWSKEEHGPVKRKDTARTAPSDSVSSEDGTASYHRPRLLPPWFQGFPFQLSHKIQAQAHPPWRSPPDTALPHTQVLLLCLCGTLTWLEAGGDAKMRI